MNATANGQPRLFTPLELRGVTVPNRVVVAPMCQYSATGGVTGDWHLANLAKFAMGGAGLIFTEASAVEERGRITHGCVGLWRDDQIAPLARITEFLKDHGSVPGIQIAHAGRKAATQRPWEGGGPLGDQEAARGEGPWPLVAPSAEAAAEGWQVPQALTAEDIAGLIDKFAEAAKRAVDAGFEVIEIHGAHGYLVHSFLSPLSNHRNDEWGGDRAGRMRFALAVTEAVRAAWPDDKPLFFRVSAVDGTDDGWAMEDTVVLAKELGALGVDVIDCSSRGVDPKAPPLSRGGRGPAYQVAYAEQVRKEAGVMSMAVGMITEPEQAEAIVRDGQADLVAIAREFLYNPSWTLHAAIALGVEQPFSIGPDQYAYWLERRDARAKTET